MRETLHPDHNKTFSKSPARPKSRPQTSLALFSYVQTNQFAPYCLLETSSRCAELGRDVIHHPPDGLSDCARSSVLWATSAHLSLPGLNDVPGTLQTVEKEFFTKLGLIRSARFARAPIKTAPLTKRAVERRTLPRKLELFKARTGSPRKKKTGSRLWRDWKCINKLTSVDLHAAFVWAFL